MWSKFVRFFCKSKAEEELRSHNDIMEEIDLLKKSLRKQSAFLDLFKKEVVEKLEEKRIEDVNPFVETAEAFFYYDRSQREKWDLSSNQQQGLEIVWQKMEALVNCVGVKMVRQLDVPFDPRLHEAMERLPEGDGRPVVKGILQPGFVHGGRVIKPAKVMIEREKRSLIAEREDYGTEE
jgi:molecular chaperone GrpE